MRIRKASSYTELRNIRIMKNMNLKDIAEQMGVTTMFISEVERGKKQPNDELTRQLAKAYGIEERLVFSYIGRVSEEMKKVVIEEKPIFNLIYKMSTGEIEEDKKKELIEGIQKLCSDLKITI